MLKEGSMLYHDEAFNKFLVIVKREKKIWGRILTVGVDFLLRCYKKVMSSLKNTTKQVGQFARKL